MAIVTPGEDEIAVEDVRVVAWLDDPPAEMHDALALMRETADALNEYTTLSDA